MFHVETNVVPLNVWQCEHNGRISGIQAFYESLSACDNFSVEQKLVHAWTDIPLLKENEIYKPQYNSWNAFFYLKFELSVMPKEDITVSLLLDSSPFLLSPFLMARMIDVRHSNVAWNIMLLLHLFPICA
jgi:hypothetical protein